MTRINHLVGFCHTQNYSGAGTNYPIRTVGGAYYIVYIEAITMDLVYRKSTNGTTWSDPVVIFTGTVTAVATWYDRWSNISAGLIHIAYQESGTDDTRYRTINTESSDSLSTETVVQATTSTAGGGALSITRARGGNVYVKTCIDAGAEGGFFRLPNANVPNGAWDAARTDTEALATGDQWALVPGFAADNQDIMCIFWDASADEISRYIYDDSGNSWGETSISGSMVDVDPVIGTYPHFAVAVDLTNSQILVVAWNGVDTANQDLLGWKVTESAITAFTTTPVLNATDDCGFAAIGIDTDTEDWYVYYGGKADGSDTWNGNISFNYKKSTDDGATWGTQTDLFMSGSADTAERASNPFFMWACPRFGTRQIIAWGTTVFLFAGVDEPAAPGGSGLASNLFGGGVVQ